jgi:methanogenic corrinoid protein MtbC1
MPLHPITEEYSRSIGADGYGRDAGEAADCSRDAGEADGYSRDAGEADGYSRDAGEAAEQAKQLIDAVS